MPAPPLELDERYFTIVAQAPHIALTQHKQTGRFAIWRLDWRCSGQNTSYNADEAASAWEQYLKECST